MKSNTALAGECMYEDFRLEYQVVSLEFIRNKHIKVEAVCYNPHNTLDKEAILKYSTNNFNSNDGRLEIALSMLDSLTKNLNLQKETLYKLIIKDHQVFYLHKI